MLRGFDGAIEIARGFVPFDLVGAITRGQHGFDPDGYGLGLGALERGIGTVELCDKSVGRGGVGDLRVDPVDCLALGDAIGGDGSQILFSTPFRASLVTESFTKCHEN